MFRAALDARYSKTFMSGKILAPIEPSCSGSKESGVKTAFGPFASLHCKL